MAGLAQLPTKLVQFATPRLQTFWYYAKVELTPPSPTDFPRIKNDFSKLIKSYKSGAWKQLSVKEAFLNTLVATEIGCWFFIGECIGKRHFIGYDLSKA